MRDLAPAAGTVGQPRALQALKMGVALRSRGYNVYVAGPTGTGRTSTVRQVLEALKPALCPVLKDYVFVHNFADPNAPRLLTFPVGQARKFEREMTAFVSSLKTDVPALFEDESFKVEAERIRGFYNELQQKLLSAFELKLRDSGFTLVKVRAGAVVVPQIAPLIEGQPVSLDALETLVHQGKLKEEQAHRLAQQQEKFREEMDLLAKRLNQLSAEMAEKFRELERSSAVKLIEAHIGRIREQFRQDRIREYLDEVKEDILDHLDGFRGVPSTEEGEAPNPLKMLLAAKQDRPEDDPRTRVNVVLGGPGRQGCPVVFEEAPTWANLVGTIKVDVTPGGSFETNHTHISCGSLLKADGGFLVMKALDLFLMPGSWQALKRVLKTGRLEITLPESPLFPGRVALKPESIPVDVKVILIGESFLYDLLYLNDEEFRATFKVKAEFDSRMDLTPDTVKHYVSVLSKICETEKLLPLGRDGLKQVIELGVRRAGRQGRLSTKFADIGDVLREAAYWAGEARAAEIGEIHVRRAVAEMERRHDLIEEKIQEMIEEGVINLRIEGERVGEVNGLSVLDTGMYSFGKPTRITASVSMGKSGLINIEREAGLSGHIYDKGVLIISGFLRDRYAKDFPLSMSASLAFEQSYSGVDGDSASSTEVYALLSALSGVPLWQSIAVTGAVDQRGNVQAVGGLNEKIEGFFRVCKIRGLTGEQGVIIPRSNVGDLMLREEIVDAVRDGKFRIWGISSVDEGIELLTGRPAGERGGDGKYPTGSINALVETRLREFARRLAEFERP